MFDAKLDKEDDYAITEVVVEEREPGTEEGQSHRVRAVGDVLSVDFETTAWAGID